MIVDNQDCGRGGHSSFLPTESNHAAQTNTYLRRTDARTRGPDRHPQRLGRRLARLRRPGLHRPPRPLRADPGRLRARGSARPPSCRPRELRNEYVVGVKGIVAPRLPGKENPKLKTGAIEVRATSSRSSTPRPRRRSRSTAPEPNEELRLKYRYLDLRRPAMQQVFIAPPPDGPAHAQHDDRTGLPRGRDADPGPQHARRRARLPRPQPAARRALLRPAAVARSSSSSS